MKLQYLADGSSVIDASDPMLPPDHSPRYTLDQLNEAAPRADVRGSPAQEGLNRLTRDIDATRARANAVSHLKPDGSPVYVESEDSRRILLRKAQGLEETREYQLTIGHQQVAADLLDREAAAADIRAQAANHDEMRLAVEREVRERQIKQLADVAMKNPKLRIG